MKRAEKLAEDRDRAGSGAPHMRIIADYLPSPVAYYDRSLVCRYVNPAGAAWQAKAVEEIVGTHMSDDLSFSELRALQPRHDAVLAGEPQRYEDTANFRDGSTRRVQTEYVPHVDDDGVVVGFFVMLHDVTERYLAEEAAKDSAQRLRMISDAVPAQICLLDRDRRYLSVNRTTAEWLGREASDIVGRTTEELYGKAFADSTADRFEAALAGERVDFETAVDYPNGASRTLDVTYIPNVSAAGRIDGVILLASDVTDYKRTEEELRRLAMTDPLTGVSNRRRFLAACEEELVRARRYDRPISVVMCDLDHFKKINDTFGHDGGDAVLKCFAAEARAAVRDGIDTVGRLGGEEFALLLPETDIAGARAVAERLRRRCADTEIPTPGGIARITCSFGVADVSGTDRSVGELLKRADLALYCAKAAGRNRVGTGVDCADEKTAADS